MSTLDDDAPPILHRVDEAGHAVFTVGAYNLNLIGVRSGTTAPDEFDDRLHLIYRDPFGRWQDLAFCCTTDPGLYWLHHPTRRQGTAILKAGQYRSSHRIGRHRGRYPALVQRRPMTVWRDRNLDDTLDHLPGTEDTGLHGINIHHAGTTTTEDDRVHRWSAGCTVLANLSEWGIFWAVIQRSAERWGSTFTYTLIEE